MSKKAMIRTRRRGGFTLIETIVTIGLIAVIAAFVVPTVIQKAGAGDPVKVQNDLNTVRTAIETFATDVKNGFPHQINSLTVKPVAGTDRFLDSTAFTTNQVSVWNGPYMAATVGTAVGDSLATGYTAYIMNNMDRYDVVTNHPEHDPVTGALNGTFVKTNTLFATVQVHGLTYSQAIALNRLFDGDVDVAQADSSNITGRFRWPKPVTTGQVSIAYFLASPIT